MLEAERLSLFHLILNEVLHKPAESGLNTPIFPGESYTLMFTPRKNCHLTDSNKCLH